MIDTNRKGTILACQPPCFVYNRGHIEMMYRRADHTAWRNLGDETVLVDLAANEMYGLNPTAGYVWQALEGSVDLNELAARLENVTCEQLKSFCSELFGLGLLVEADPVSDEAESVPVPEESEPPALLWRESIRQAAATCAFLPAQNPLCVQAPFS